MEETGEEEKMKEKTVEREDRRGEEEEGEAKNLKIKLPIMVA
jgi:hypothetical protein